MEWKAKMGEGKWGVQWLDANPINNKIFGIARGSIYTVDHLHCGRTCLSLIDLTKLKCFVFNIKLSTIRQYVEGGSKIAVFLDLYGISREGNFKKVSSVSH